MVNHGTARLILYRIFFFFAAVTFGLAVGLTGKSIADYRIYSPPVLALIAVSLLSYIVIAPLHLCFHRRNANSTASSVAVEVSVLAIFCACYLGAAAATASALGVGFYCHLIEIDYYTDYYYSIDDGECGISRGLTAAGFLVALILLVLIILVVSTSVSHSNKGNKSVWTNSYPMNQSTAEVPFIPPQSTAPYSTGPYQPYQPYSQGGEGYQGNYGQGWGSGGLQNAQREGAPSVEGTQYPHSMVPSYAQGQYQGVPQTVV